MMKAIRQQVLSKQALPNVINLKFLGAGLLLLVLLLLTGCGEDAFVCDSDDCSVSSGSTSGTTGGTGTSTTSGIYMTMTISNATLLTGETATVTARILNADATAYTTVTNVTFTTSCPSSTITASVPTSGGVATASYIAGGCTGTDTITANATADSEPVSATVNVAVSAPTLNIQLGRGNGVTFELGLLATGTGAASDAQTALSAGGSTTVTATLVDADNLNALYGTVTNVNFSSTCVAAGNASMTTPIATVGGTATTTYVATGCSGDDTITASATVDGSVKTAQQVITVAPATVGSVQFISANPSVIALAGTGGGGLQETSTLTFKVVDNIGGGVPNQIVDFALNTNVGGIQLSSVSGVTLDDGTVTVIVQSGTIPTPVNVTATTADIVSGFSYSTQSDALVISTGRADQDSFSISAFGGCNPAGAWDTNGITVPINILAADHFNNPVPDGTSISFRTEGGAIDGSCQTSNGTCGVTWRSQNPRPADGRTTILATAIGNESYLDANSNGGYDDGDPVFTDPVAAGPLGDMGEAWLDIDDDGNYDFGVEEFVDFNLDGVYTGPDGLFTGVLCFRTGGCSTSQTLHVRQSIGIVMGSTIERVDDIDINGGNAIGPLNVITDNPPFTEVDIVVTSGTDNPATTTVVEGHSVGQYPAAGTSISVETTNGTIIGATSFVVPSTCNFAPNTGYTATVQLQGDGVPDAGTLSVTVTSPGGQPIVKTATVND